MLTSGLGGAAPANEVLGRDRGGALARGLTVSRVVGLAAIEQLGSEIDRLNAVSARPSPFASAAYLRCYALRSEYHTPGRAERLFLVRAGDRLIGCAPMRETVDRLGPGGLGFKGVRLEVLAPQDSEQPSILCAPEDEERVAAAVIRHLCDDEPGWGMLELVSQRPGSPVHAAAHAATGPTYRVRDIAVEPFTEVPMSWPDLPAYFRGLNKKMRSNISRQARRLYATGQVELVLAEGGNAVGAWFKAYCDVDHRSWKCETASSILRSSRRVKFYREIAVGRGGFDPSFVGVVLDGVLVAGLLMGSNRTSSPQRHGAWCLEMAYDRTRADLGPGQLLLLLAVGESIKHGHRFLNFMQNFAYYKHRWGAESIPVVNVQVIRRLSPHNTGATAGDLRRWLQSRRLKPAQATEPAGAEEPAKHKDGGQDQNQQQASGPPPDHSQARALAAAALAYAGPGLRRLDRAAARAYLPFDIE